MITSHMPNRTNDEWAEDVAETLRIESDRGTMANFYRMSFGDAMIALFREPWLPLDVWSRINWYGPLEEWRRPEMDVSDILFNGPADDPFFVIQYGVMTNTGTVVHPSWISFVQRQLLLRGRKITADGDGSWYGPYAQGVTDRLRYAITAAPFSRDGGSIAVRLLPERWRTLDDLIDGGVVTREASALLLEALRAGASVLVAGATGSGKTTLTAGFTQELGRRQRLVFVEDGGELPRAHNSLHLEVNAEQPEEFPGAIRLALRQKPNYIIVGEVRGGEAMALLQAAATGHPGIGTIHATNTQAALRNLERMAMMGLAAQASGGGQAAASIVRGLICSDSVNLIVVHIGQAPNGRRSVLAIDEVLKMGAQGNSGDPFPLNALYRYDEYAAQLVRAGNVNGAWGYGRL